MALPARLLEQLPPQVTVGVSGKGSLGRGAPERGAIRALNASLVSSGLVSSPGVGLPPETGLPLGIGPLDALLPDAGLPRGAVTELAVAGGAALGSSLSLAACRAAQEQARLRGGEPAWCAFVDPWASLHAPAVAAAGVDLERLLVVRPPLEALSRVVVRLAESQVFAVVVVDLAGVPGATAPGPLARAKPGSRGVDLGRWTRVVRRLALATASTDCCVLLLTAWEAPRPLPLPVALRVELQRVGRHQLRLQIGKDRRGRISGASTVELVPGLRSSRSEPPSGGSPQGHVDAIAG